MTITRNALLAATALLAVACSPKTEEAATPAGTETAAAAPAPGPGEPTLAEVKAASEKYRDIKVALAEGFIRDPMDYCETAPMMGKPVEAGAMGIHYFRPDLVGVPGPVAPGARVDGTDAHRLPQAGRVDLRTPGWRRT